MKLPLSSTRVLDLTRVLAGPLCTMMLGDLGADVIKVERPGSGDETRSWGPPFDLAGRSAYFLSVNRNKLSLAANLQDPEDLDLVARLAASADVVVENYIPGTLARLGLDSSDLLSLSPRLVWCSITGFGDESTRPGYDFVVQAESGWMAITGEPEGLPMKVGVALADIVAGKDAAIAILAALAGRSNGAERHVVVSLADSARAALANVAQNALVTGTEARRWGNAHANLVPYQLFRASDRPFVIAVGSDAQWVACASALGLTELAADDGLATNAGRIAQRERVVEAMQRALLRRPASEWIAQLDAARVPCGVVKSVLEAVHDAGSASPVYGMPPSAGGSIRHKPPGLDEHGPLIRARGWDSFPTTGTH